MITKADRLMIDTIYNILDNGFKDAMLYILIQILMLLSITIKIKSFFKTFKTVSLMSFIPSMVGGPFIFSILLKVIGVTSYFSQTSFIQATIWGLISLLIRQ